MKTIIQLVDLCLDMKVRVCLTNCHKMYALFSTLSRYSQARTQDFGEGGFNIIAKILFVPPRRYPPWGFFTPIIEKKSN